MRVGSDKREHELFPLTVLLPHTRPAAEVEATMHSACYASRVVTVGRGVGTMRRTN
jgi:hypothetical protein